MHLGILSGLSGWHVEELHRAAKLRGHTSKMIDFRRLVATNAARSRGPECDAVVVRSMPLGSLEQVVFRMDVLHAWELSGVPVWNSPKSLEICIDKYLANVRLEAAGLPVARTWVGQSAEQALEAFAELGSNVVVKPIFGSEGRGMMHITDDELAWRTFHALERQQAVIYLQAFIPHAGWDVRVFLIGAQAFGMRRVNRRNWRTNVAQGAVSEALEPTPLQLELARKAQSALGVRIAGVDLIQDDSGKWFVLEVNAVPGWKALAPTLGIDIAALIIDEVTA